MIHFRRKNVILLLKYRDISVILLVWNYNLWGTSRIQIFVWVRFALAFPCEGRGTTRHTASSEAILLRFAFCGGWVEYATVSTVNHAWAPMPYTVRLSCGSKTVKIVSLLLIRLLPQASKSTFPHKGRLTQSVTWGKFVAVKYKLNSSTNQNLK